MAVSDQIIQVLDELCRRFGLAIDWTSENVLPYAVTLCEKLVKYEVATSVVWLVIVMICVISLVCVLKSCGVKNLDSIDRFGVYLFATTFGMALLGIPAVIQIMDIVKCTTFPELYVFEYIQRLVNKG